MSTKPTSMWSDALGRRVIGSFATMQGGLLPALHALQAEFGFVPKPAIQLLADIFNITRAEVFGVVTFYHDFRIDEPSGKRVLKLCRAEACQATGGDELAEIAKKRLNLSWGETTSDGEWTLQAVFCLGLCACGPSAMVGEKLFARLDENKLCALLDEPAS